MNAVALSLWLLARSLTGDVTDPTAAQEAKLKAAIQSVNDLRDDEARTLLDDLLAQRPVDHIAAQANLYLGLIDFNAVDFTHGREEFRRALEFDPTIEVPPMTSPKVALSFARIRQELLKTMTLAAPAAPAAAVAPPPLVVQEEAPRGSGAWPWIFGVAAIAAAGVSVWGWVQVANFESLKSSSSFSSPLTATQAQSAQSSASVGEPVGIVGIVAAAGLSTGLVLTW